MPPHSAHVAPINELIEDTKEEIAKHKIKKSPFLTEIVWSNAISISLLLITGFYLFFTFPWREHYKTVVFG